MRKQKPVNRALVQLRRADQSDRSRLLSLIPQYCPLLTSWIIANMNFDTDVRTNFVSLLVKREIGEKLKRFQ